MNALRRALLWPGVLLSILLLLPAAVLLFLYEVIADAVDWTASHLLRRAALC